MKIVNGTYITLFGTLKIVINPYGNRHGYIITLVNQSDVRYPFSSIYDNIDEAEKDILYKEIKVYKRLLETVDECNVKEEIIMELI